MTSRGHSERQTVEIAWLTWALCVLNVGMHVLGVYVGGSVVLILNQPPVLALLGANYAAFTQYAGQWELLVTSMFLHGGAVHLLFNMVALFQVGPMVERTVGRARFAVLYMVSGIVASVVSMLASNLGALEVGVSVGASGAICGLIGGAAVLGYRIQGRGSPLARAMVRWLALIVVFGYVLTWGGRMNVDNYAHLGGAACGALTAMSFRRGVAYSNVGRTLRVAVCAAIVVAAFATLGYRGIAQPASWRAKMMFSLRQCGPLSQELVELGLDQAGVGAIVSRCESGLREK